MAFCPGSVIAGDYSQLQEVYYRRLREAYRQAHEASLPTHSEKPVEIGPVFTVWEVLFFVWLLVAMIFFCWRIAG